MPLVSAYKNQGFLFTENSFEFAFFDLPKDSIKIKEKEIELTDYQKTISSAGDYTAYSVRLASGVVPFHSYDQQQDYFHKRRQVLSGDACVSLNSHIEPAQRLGFKTRIYPSGEMTGGCFMSGARSASSPPPVRDGVLESIEFTQRARVKIRRASECSPVDLKTFITLTFAPNSFLSVPDPCLPRDFVGPRQLVNIPCVPDWAKDENGSVLHDFAKYKIKKFLNTCRMMIFRKDRQSFVGPVCKVHDVLHLQYIWVAELQQNGNIHFHVLADRFIPIKKLSEWWGQASNSVDVKRLDDSRHAVNYMRKYMTKDENSLIQGNRYFITKGLHDAMKPEDQIISDCRPNHEDSALVPWGEGNSIRDILQDMKIEIQRHGGTVLDFGFSCPAPRRSRFYKDKKTGEKKRSTGVSKQLSSFVIAAISLSIPDCIPF